MRACLSAPLHHTLHLVVCQVLARWILVLLVLFVLLGQLQILLRTDQDVVGSLPPSSWQAQSCTAPEGE